MELQGTPTDLYQNHNEFVELVGIVESEKSVEKSEILSRRNSKTSSIKSLPGKPNSINLNESIKKDEGVQLEASSKGKVKGSLSLQYFRAGGSWSTLFGLASLFIFVQFLASAVDYWVSVW